MIVFLSGSLHNFCQSVSASIPQLPNKNDNYLFYLHGGVVSIKGDKGINDAMPEWGPYEYLNILDSLKHRGFHVISEIRPRDISDTAYAEKIIRQVDTLFKAGIHARNILILGASAGWGIGILVSGRLAQDDLSYVLMGGCWPDTYKDYISTPLHGRFLSIIEKTDPHGTCKALFKDRPGLSWREIELNTGLSHGFIYKGHKAWIDPVVSWFNENR